MGKAEKGRLFLLWVALWVWGRVLSAVLVLEAGSSLWLETLLTVDGVDGIVFFFLLATRGWFLDAAN